MQKVKTFVADLWETTTDSQIWKSIFRHGAPTSNRNRVLVVMSNVFLHLHPVKSRKAGIKLRYTWCMGGITFFLFLVLTFTGLLLMFYYRPTVEYAYADIVDLREHVPLGIMREIHRWGAHAMVITVWLHMFRVFMTGSYKPPREFNWGIGVVLLVLTLLLSFTGYLLPWDSLAFGAATIGINMASSTPLVGSWMAKALFAGTTLSGQTVTRMYFLHVFILPVLVTGLILAHLFIVWVQGIAEPH